MGWRWVAGWHAGSQHLQRASTAPKSDSSWPKAAAGMPAHLFLPRPSSRTTVECILTQAQTHFELPQAKMRYSPDYSHMPESMVRTARAVRSLQQQWSMAQRSWMLLLDAAIME